MFYFQLFGQEASFDEKYNTLICGGEKQSFSMSPNQDYKRSVYFKFNSICNLRCTYCFQKESDNTHFSTVELKDYEALIDRIIENDIYNRLVLFGGEPFIKINYDNIKTLLERCKKKKICAFSNGTFDDCYIELLYLHASKIEMITITIDGSPKAHNQRRIYPNGEGSFDVIISRLMQMQSKGLPFTIQINIDQDNINELDGLLELIQGKFPNVSAVILNRVLHDEKGITELELLRYFIRLKRKYCRICIVPNSQCYKKLYSIITNNGIIYKRCEISNTYVFDFQSHLIYSCPQSDKTICGYFNTNTFVIKQNKIEELDQYSRKENDICKECNMRGLCMFGCAIDEDLHGINCYRENKSCIQFIFDNLSDIYDLE